MTSPPPLTPPRIPVPGPRRLFRRLLTATRLSGSLPPWRRHRLTGPLVGDIPTARLVADVLTGALTRRLYCDLHGHSGGYSGYSGGITQPGHLGPELGHLGRAGALGVITDGGLPGGDAFSESLARDFDSGGPDVSHHLSIPTGLGPIGRDNHDIRHIRRIGGPSCWYGD